MRANAAGAEDGTSSGSVQHKRHHKTDRPQELEHWQPLIIVVVIIVEVGGEVKTRSPPGNAAKEDLWRLS